MAFQSGAINAGGFLACHRFVTHTTGFSTFFGTEVAQGNFSAAWGMLSVPLFFLMGAMTSGFFVDRRLALGKRPRYDWMFSFICLVMVYVALAGEKGSFGIFGAPWMLSSDYTLMALLCLCSGIQNATITLASGAVIRTSHLTGITTDLGVGLVRAFGSAQSDLMRKNEIRGNWLRAGLILSFTFGSVVSAFLFFQIHYLGFFVPAFISGSLAAFLIVKRKKTISGESHARAS